MRTSRKPAITDPLSLLWRKSSHSGGEGGMCVEVADVDGGVVLRDSADPHGPVLAFSDAEWDAFLAGVHDGEFASPARPVELASPAGPALTGATTPAANRDQ